MSRSRVVLILVLGVGLAAVAWGIFRYSGIVTPPRRVLDVPAGDQEIAWLHTATSGAAWERFVTALERLEKEYPGLEVRTGAAFPRDITAVPELAVSLKGKTGSLRFRWYKLSADMRTGDWVDALMERRTPPLAIIGGSSSDLARDQAEKLEKVRHDAAGRTPLFFITRATADMVYAPDDGKGEPQVLAEGRELTKLYPGRTFRFCFTNGQMAEAVADFLWATPELRPADESAYVVYWQDDPYSEDLARRFDAVLPVRSQALEGILHSMGGYGEPNRPEQAAVQELLNYLARDTARQGRALLVLPASSAPARRFLRGLARSGPDQTGRLVVATGDSIDFNSLYRDRHTAWPIQDLPFSLVCFAHRQPVHPDHFRPEGAAATGTEDLLLYKDIVHAVVQAAYRGDALVDSADRLADSLGEARVTAKGDIGFGDGERAYFSKEGNRLSAAGEFLVWLEPVRAGERVLPEARLRVYQSVADPSGIGIPSYVGGESFRRPTGPPSGERGGVSPPRSPPRQWKLERDLKVNYAAAPAREGEP